MRARLFEEVEASANYYTTRGKSIVPIDSCCQVLPKTSQPSLPSLEVEGGGGREIPPKALPCQWCWMVLKLTFMAHLHANIDMKYKVSVKHQSSPRLCLEHRFWDLFTSFSHLFLWCLEYSTRRRVHSSITITYHFSDFSGQLSPLSKSQDVWWKRGLEGLFKKRNFIVFSVIFFDTTTISFLLWIVESYFYSRTFFDLGSSGYEGVVKHR